MHTFVEKTRVFFEGVLGFPTLALSISPSTLFEVAQRRRFFAKGTLQDRRSLFPKELAPAVRSEKSFALTSNEVVRSKECFALRRMWSFEEGALRGMSAKHFLLPTEGSPFFVRPQRAPLRSLSCFEEAWVTRRAFPFCDVTFGVQKNMAEEMGFEPMV